MIWVTKNVNQARRNRLLNYGKMSCYILYFLYTVEPRGVLRPASQADRHAVLARPGWEVRHAKGGPRGTGIRSFFGHYLISPKIGYSNANWSLNAYKSNFITHFFVIRGKSKKCPLKPKYFESTYYFFN